MKTLTIPHHSFLDAPLSSYLQRHALRPPPPPTRLRPHHLRQHNPQLRSNPLIPATRPLRREALAQFPSDDHPRRLFQKTHSIRTSRAICSADGQRHVGVIETR